MAVGRKATNKKPSKPETIKKKCDKCTKLKPIGQFYKSNNPNHSHGVFDRCKVCVKPNNPEDKHEVRLMLSALDRPFINSVWDETVEEVVARGNWSSDSYFGIYLKNIQMNNGKYEFATFKDTEDVFLNEKVVSPKLVIDNKSDHEAAINHEVKIINRNEQDCLRMLGYDPFVNTPESEREHLFNKLIDFLDEGTLEDSFKLPAVIEIVKTYNQLDKINLAIDKITIDAEKLTVNASSIKSLIDSKDKMLKSVLALAKDNGISVNHSNNKSKGAGTLSGIIKELNELGLDDARVNVYDIETCAGMKQVADISNKSIFEQLMMDENDYVEMIATQRDMITRYQNENEALKEEIRLIKLGKQEE